MAQACVADPRFTGCPRHGPSKVAAVVDQLVGVAADRDVDGALWTQSSDNDSALGCAAGVRAAAYGNQWPASKSYNLQARVPRM